MDHFAYYARFLVASTVFSRLLSVLFILGLLSSSAFAQANTTAPNILVIVTDDLGSGDLGAYGARDAKTPNIDALAASGVRFTNWYAAAPTCSPSRAALLTGRYPVRAGVPGIVKSSANVVGLRADEVTLAEVLKTRGYRTGLIGKWHLGSAAESRPNAQGFDYFFGFLSGCIDYYSHMYYWGERDGVANFHDLWRNDIEVWEDGQYMTELITREAARFINDSATNPFLLFVTYNAPHYPMQAPKKYLDRFKNLPRERQTHLAMIAAVDDGVGEMMELLRRQGSLKNTLVFFVSDNGASDEERITVSYSGSDSHKAGSNAPFRGYKFSLFEGGIRIPALMSWPARIQAGQVSDAVGTGMDVFTTITRAAGADLPNDRTIDGKDMWAVVAAHESRSPHAALYWAEGKQRAIRKGKWKLVLNGMLDQNEKLTGADAVFLSDLEQDPGETVNLRAKHPQIVEELTRLIEKQEKQWRQR